MAKWLKPWKVNDPITASRLNDMQNVVTKVVGSPPVSVRQIGDVVYIGMDGMYLPKLVRVVSRSSDFAVVRSSVASDWSDANRYWVQEALLLNSDASSSDSLVFSDLGSDYEYCVQNLAEPSDSHSLPVDRPAIMFRRQDQSSDWTVRYFISEAPKLCMSSDWTTSKDLSDLSTYVSDRTEDLPGRTNFSDLLDISDLVSDLNLVVVRGQMYKDANSDLNPWWMARLPFAFPVKVEKSDGFAGDKDSDCSYTYTVKTLDGVAVAGGVAPTKVRLPKTTYLCGSDYGLAFYDGTTLKLWDANERPEVSDCG